MVPLHEYFEDLACSFKCPSVLQSVDFDNTKTHGNRLLVIRSSCTTSKSSVARCSNSRSGVPGRRDPHQNHRQTNHHHHPTNHPHQHHHQANHQQHQHQHHHRDTTLPELIRHNDVVSSIGGSWRAASVHIIHTTTSDGKHPGQAATAMPSSSSSCQKSGSSRSLDEHVVLLQAELSSRWENQISPVVRKKQQQCQQQQHQEETAPSSFVSDPPRRPVRKLSIVDCSGSENNVNNNNTQQQLSPAMSCSATQAASVV